MDVAVGCDGCGGPMVERVRYEGNRNPFDDFDQLSDHPSQFFTAATFLSVVAESSGGTITVWRLHADRPDSVIAYAGPHPGGADYRLWIRDMDEVGTFAELQGSPS